MIYSNQPSHLKCTLLHRDSSQFLLENNTVPYEVDLEYFLIHQSRKANKIWILLFSIYDKSTCDNTESQLSNLIPLSSIYATALGFCEVTLETY